jgi:hypothetical protein
MASKGREDEAVQKEIVFRMHARDVEIVERMKRKFGCSTTAAIRACLRIADDVKLKLATDMSADDD